MLRWVTPYYRVDADRDGRGRAIAVSPHSEATEALHAIISQSIRWTTGRIEL